MRFLFHADLSAAGEEIALDQRESQHLFTILRARVGDRVGLLDGCGGSAEAEIVAGRRLRLLGERRAAPRPERRIHLLVAPPRHLKMEQLLRQCAEVGVWRISPVATVREVARPGHETTPERWHLALIEGCKQAHNPFLPEIQPCRPLAAALATPVADECWFGDPAGDRLPPSPRPNGDVAWLVGPEGGFTPDEREAIIAAGFRPLSLGPWWLRIETAAIVGAALLAH